MEPALNSKPLSSWTPDERISVVKKIFNGITPSYDLLNRIMSARQDVRWRRYAASRVPEDARLVLDIAVGTGDLALEIARRGNRSIVGVDFVESMMRLAVGKTQAEGLTHAISYGGADAMCLPFGDNTFDAAVMAFGLRNMPDRITPLREAARVVKPGGKVLVLEMTFPRSTRLRGFFRWYLNKIIPILGTLISGNTEAYRYLPDSIQDFMSPDELSEFFRQAGLKDIKPSALTLGLTYLHEGTVQ